MLTLGIQAQLERFSQSHHRINGACTPLYPADHLSEEEEKRYYEISLAFPDLPVTP
jgi:hypothetical protein